MNDNNLSLRPASEFDLPAMAAIHLRAYSTKHFTSRLPAGVLVEYYRSFLSGGAEAWVATMAEDSLQERIVGFAVFGRGIDSKIAEFTRANTAAIIRASMRYPLIAGRKAARRLLLKSACRRPRRAAAYLLLSIAVAESGRGFGGRLLDALLSRAAEDGASTVGLYVNADNVDAINAYVRRGFLMCELYAGQFYMERSV